MTDSDLLAKWCADHQLQVIEVEPRLWRVADKLYYLLQPDAKGHLFDVLEDQDSTLVFLIPGAERRYIAEKQAQVLFRFGQCFFYSSSEEVFFNDFRYLGQAEDITPLPHLGVHSDFDIASSVGRLEHYAQKARFSGCPALGLVDKNTLAGAIEFQLKCTEYGIKPIFGVTLDVVHDDEAVFELVIYAANLHGWQNMLRMVNIANDDPENRRISLQTLLTYSQGLHLLLTKKSVVHTNRTTPQILEILKKYHNGNWESIHYGLDSVHYRDTGLENRQREFLRRYVTELVGHLPPVVFNESYYVDRSEAPARYALLKMSRRNDGTTNDQFFKTYRDAMNAFLFLGRDHDIMTHAYRNTLALVDACDFRLDLTRHKLSAYYHDRGCDNDTLFVNLLIEGMERKCPPGKESDYMNRLEREVDVIRRAGFVDYFLILWDIVSWARRNDILVGPGRGSAGGSLVAYMLDITQVDPIRFDLLFERFLNEARVSGELAQSSDALPDVDIDFESNARDKVKEYIRQRFGERHVVSVGAFTRYKLRAALGALMRLHNVPRQEGLRLTQAIEEDTEYTFADLLRTALMDNNFRSFVIRYPEVIENTRVIMGAPSATSVHAAAVVIVPDKDEHGNPVDVNHWLPVRREKGLLVTEWEGVYVAKAGYLKEDILGVTQLDKIHKIMDLVLKHTGTKPDLLQVPLDDPSVFHLFVKGLNDDVSQFGSRGVKAYCKQLRPKDFEDLIAILALYRPGPMGTGGHLEYAAIKNGEKKAHYDYGLREIVQKTYGILVYQEQVIQAAQVLGGMSPSEGDNMRRAIGKKKKDELVRYHDLFVKGAVDRGCLPQEAEKIWAKMETFGRYGFNRSHAAAYAMVGYWSQWLKVYFPLEFWTVALNYSSTSDSDLRKPKHITYRLAEMKALKVPFELRGVNINLSEEQFVCEAKEEAIYWSITKVKGCGSAAVAAIMEARDQGGPFFSLEDFLDRIPRSKVKKDQIEALILAGAFDRCEFVSTPKDRRKILEAFFAKDALPEKYQSMKADQAWVSLQYEVSRFGHIDYSKLLPPHVRGYYVEGSDFISIRSYERGLKVVTGRILGVKSVKSVKNKYNVQVENHHAICEVSLILSHERDAPALKVGSQAWFSGSVWYNHYRGMPVLVLENANKGKQWDILF